jgi:hypothetical protein
MTAWPRSPLIYEINTWVWLQELSLMSEKPVTLDEAYWNLEWGLQQQGFDACYDKRLYDRLEHDTADPVRLHLCADLQDFYGKLLPIASGLRNGCWQLCERNGDEMYTRGIYVDLPPWGYHILARWLPLG